NTLQRRRCASAIRALPSMVLGPVDSPPWNRQRRFPGTNDARGSGSGLGAAPWSEFALQRKLSVRQAAPEQRDQPALRLRVSYPLRLCDDDLQRNCAEVEPLRRGKIRCLPACSRNRSQQITTRTSDAAALEIP